MEENNFKLLYLVLISKLKTVLNMSPKTLKMNHRNITVTDTLKDEAQYI